MDLCFWYYCEFANVFGGIVEKAFLSRVWSVRCIGRAWPFLVGLHESGNVLFWIFLDNLVRILSIWLSSFEFDDCL